MIVAVGIAIGIAIGIETTRRKFDSDPDTDPRAGRNMLPCNKLTRLQKL